MSQSQPASTDVGPFSAYKNTQILGGYAVFQLQNEEREQADGKTSREN